MRIGSLFSGAGGLDRAVEAVFGGHTVWHSEIDKAASKVLAYRWPDVPNLGSITEIDWAAVEPVDVLCGGFPCQDVSAAGKRAGIKDGTRSGLWAVFAEAIDALRPRYVVIENVRGLLSATAHRDMESDDAVVGDGSDRPVLRALGAVLGDLSDIGYDAVWATVAAADVGAPHRRERVFIVACAADTKGDGWDGRPSDQLPIGAGDLRRVGGPGATTVGDGGGIHASHSSRDGWDEGRPESAGIVGRPDAAVSGDEPGVALLPTPKAAERGDCASEHRRNDPDLRAITYYSQRWGKYAPAIARWESLTRPAPAPTEPNKNGNPRLSAEFSQWLMGWPDGWVTDPAIGISRNDQLRILGNGVVVQQAIAALRYLLAVNHG